MSPKTKLGWLVLLKVVGLILFVAASTLLVACGGDAFTCALPSLDAGLVDGSSASDSVTGIDSGTDSRPPDMGGRTP